MSSMSLRIYKELELQEISLYGSRSTTNPEYHISMMIIGATKPDAGTEYCSCRLSVEQATELRDSLTRLLDANRDDKAA